MQERGTITNMDLKVYVVHRRDDTAGEGGFKVWADAKGNRGVHQAEVRLFANAGVFPLPAERVWKGRDGSPDPERAFWRADGSSTGIL